MEIEIALVIFYAFVMCNKCAFGIYLSELFGNGEDKDPVKDKVMKPKYFKLHFIFAQRAKTRKKSPFWQDNALFAALKAKINVFF